MAEGSDGGCGLRGRRSSHLNPVRAALLVVAWMVLAGILIGVGELVDHSGAVQGFDNHVTSFVVASAPPFSPFPFPDRGYRRRQAGKYTLIDMHVPPGGGPRRFTATTSRR